MSHEVRFEAEGAYAALEIWDDNKTATLAALNATFKKRGSGTKVLRLALEHADLLQLTVLLQISPFGDDVGMNKTELRAYYMTYGFNWKGDGVMERAPDLPDFAAFNEKGWQLMKVEAE